MGVNSLNWWQWKGGWGCGGNNWLVVILSVTISTATACVPLQFIGGHVLLPGQVLRVRYISEVLYRGDLVHTRQRFCTERRHKSILQVVLELYLSCAEYLSGITADAECSSGITADAKHLSGQGEPVSKNAYQGAGKVFFR